MDQIGDLFNHIFTYPIYNVLMLLVHFFGDFGLSIIVLTLLIRFLLFPLTLKQLRSSKATQAIQPLMADIKKKYANDQRAQLAAQQALYKEYQINPLAGCLPLLIQMPVLYGLFSAMSNLLRASHITTQVVNAHIYPFLPTFTTVPSFDLRWFTFLNPHWIISLAHLDASHILPILAGLATFVQLRMSQARLQNKPGQQKDLMTQQMQVMSFIMPFVTIFFAWNFPAGLALYWTTSAIFSIVQQYFVTGWGSLFSAPSLAGASGGTFGTDSKASIGDGRKEKNLPNTIVNVDAEAMPEQQVRGNALKRDPSRS